MKRAVISSLLLLSGCAGEVLYTPPAHNGNITTQKIIDNDFDSSWKAMAKEISSTFFVINNLDKETGIINVSYSGDPEKYVDCGTIYSMVENMRGKRTYEFPGASPRERYEIMDTKGDGLLFADRSLNLDGRINILVQPDGKNKTIIIVNALYVLNRTISITSTKGSHVVNDTISFSSNTTGSFNNQDSNTVCMATGGLEKTILDLVPYGGSAHLILDRRPSEF